MIAKSNFGRARPLLASAIAVLLCFSCMDPNDEKSGLAVLGDEAMALASFLSTAIGSVDTDRDQIDDNLENQLMRRFAPTLYLHPKETSMPTNVQWVLQGSQMKHNSDNLCRDNVVLDWGRITPRNMGLQQTRGKGGAFCRSTSTRYYSNREYPEKKRFYLRVGERLYPGNLPAAKCYARVGISRKARTQSERNAGKPRIKYEIEYWWIYAYNPAVPAQVFPYIIAGAGGQHQGDWENIKVYITEDQKLHSVDYFVHGHPITHRAGDRELTLLGGTRPVVHAALFSHASYPEARKYFRNTGALMHSDYTAKDPTGKKVLNCAAANRLINVGDAKYPSRGNEWIRYRGAWGTKKRAFHPLEDSGPIGPKLRDIDWANQASLTGPSGFTFRKGDYKSRTYTYAFNSRTADKLGSVLISGYSTTDRYNASVRRSGNKFLVTFPARRDTPRATYTLKVTYSVPRAGGGGLRTTLTKTKTIGVSYQGYQPPACGTSGSGRPTRRIEPGC